MEIESVSIYNKVLCLKEKTIRSKHLKNKVHETENTILAKPAVQTCFKIEISIIWNPEQGNFGWEKWSCKSGAQ